VIDLILSARPRQWSKNLLVFAGLIFSGRFLEWDAVRISLLTFCAFCLASSAGYLFNDLLDRRSDAAHPEKRLRPIAAGRVSPFAAAAFGAALGVLAAIVAWATDWQALASVGAYVLNQLVYVLIARRVAILDVFVIAFGFLIRAGAGAFVLHVEIGQWLLLCTMLLALFLGFAKRRHELLLKSDSRSSLSGYSAPLLDKLIVISASSAVIAYSLYAIQSETAAAHPLLALTIPFPMFGVFRYLQIAYQEDGGGNPDVDLMRDPWLYGVVLVWAALSVAAMTTGGWRH